MTEYWKSNAMHWCDICKCWMNDTKAARLNHERGSQHQAKLAYKLRDMARHADQEVKTKEATDAALSKIEAAARKQFEKDRKAAEADKAAAQAAAGTWAWDPDSSYYYNSVHRWYYDPKTQWYYGGEPTPEWSQSPPLPPEAMFGVAQHEGGPVPQGAAGGGAGAAAGGGGGSGAGPGPGSLPEGLPVVTRTVKRVVAVPKHPLADVGGHQAPTTGRVGGSMGAGVVVEGSGADLAAKRKREEQAGKGGGKRGGAASAEEAEALARREAARQRVAQRTAAGFGYL